MIFNVDEDISNRFNLFSPLRLVPLIPRKNDNSLFRGIKFERPGVLASYFTSFSFLSHA